MSKEKDFVFHVPVELIKSEKVNENGENEESWQIQGIASTGDIDLQNEVVNQEGLDISAIKMGRGIFNWDHQKGPENVLGQIEDGEFIDHAGKRALLVKGYLYQHQDRAKAFHNILKSIKKGSTPRVHMSIEGKIVERDFSNQKHIKKARIDKVALTLDPVNPHTFTELCKSLNAPETVEEEVQVAETIEQTEETITMTKSELLEVVSGAVSKALSAGAGYSKAPSNMSSGESQTTEAMDSNLSVVTHQENKRKSKKKMLKSVIESMHKAHPETDPLELAEWVVEAFYDKLDKGESE